MLKTALEQMIERERPLMAITESLPEKCPAPSESTVGCLPDEMESSSEDDSWML
jgi:hypothetical protein